MNALALHEFHQEWRASFVELQGQEVVEHYGHWMVEHKFLRETAGVLDLGFRGRLCIVGADRQKFLNGQVTNNVNNLHQGQGCYAALITAKGKMQSDLYVYCLENELLLDFEPGLTEIVRQRLEKYIVADDVEVAKVDHLYGLLSVQGPSSLTIMESLQLDCSIPDCFLAFTKVKDLALGEMYLMNHARLGTCGFDLFVPASSLAAVAGKLCVAAQNARGGLCGWQALEVARVEAGIPRFGLDIDETNLPPEAGLDKRAISYSKGCYIGQEVIARIRTYGQVSKSLHRLRLPKELAVLPSKGVKLFLGEKEVGYITSAATSPITGDKVALGYVRREASKPGIEIQACCAVEGFPVVVEDEL